LTRRAAGRAAAERVVSLPSFPEPNAPIDLLGLTSAQILEHLAPLDRPYRARQIYDAIYRQGLTDFSSMTTLSTALRERLDREFCIGVPAADEVLTSEDGTRKMLLRLRDGVTVEAVDIPTPRRRTLCVSSQAGCALACTFCVTGYWGAGRNLGSGEIVGQVLAMLGKLPYGPESVNVVLMGMGEPMHNLENVRPALQILSEAISWRKMTLSTVGVVAGIREMAGWENRPNLAISLHAPDNERRDRIMPINRTHPLEELFETLAAFPLERGRKIMFEYLLIRDFNDGVEDASALADRVLPLKSKVNLIPLNPDPVLGPQMAPPLPEQVERFAARLRERGVITTVRQQRGDDVSAACGQLRAPGREPRGFRRSGWVDASLDATLPTSNAEDAPRVEPVD
jgi:23S rRNA (adenine2503-C2)-methyltransferase